MSPAETHLRLSHSCVLEKVFFLNIQRRSELCYTILMLFSCAVAQGHQWNPLVQSKCTTVAVLQEAANHKPFRLTPVDFFIWRGDLLFDTQKIDFWLGAPHNCRTVLTCRCNKKAITAILQWWLPFSSPTKITEHCSFVWRREGHSARGKEDQQQKKINNWAEIQKSYMDPSWVDYYSMSMCICVHDLYKWGLVCPCIVHTASACTVLHHRTLADGWLVLLIHSRGTNLSRQLDSLTDLTADNPAGSVSCNNLGRGVILFGSCQHDTQCFPALNSSAEPKSW